MSTAEGRAHLPSIGGYACVGVDFRAASAAVLSALQEPDPGSASLRFLEESDADEVVLLQTCNRFEVYMYSRDPVESSSRLRRLIGRRAGDEVYMLLGQEAVLHLFRIASGLESMVVGEYEILSQVRDALLRSSAAGSAGPMMKALFERAIRAGRRARSETGISRGSTSVARLAAEEISRRFPRGSRVLVVGAGHMGSSIASYLRDAGFTDVIIANRSFDRAASLASRLGYRAIQLDDLGRAMRSADAVVVAVSSPSPVITEDMIPSSDVLLLDISIPGAVERSTSHPPSQLLTIDDLVGLAEENRRRRIVEAEEAGRVAAEEAVSFEDYLRDMAADDVIRSFMEKAESIRSAELERAMRILDMDDRAEVLEAMTKAIVNKVSAPIIEALRDAGRRGDRELLERLKAVFDGFEARQEL
ncbi:MAG: glutamyl-tRNA reductase [Conexivisphaera sp.]